MRIHSRIDSDEIMQAALESFVAVLGAQAGDIKTRDAEDWVVRFASGLGPEAVGLRLSPAEAPIAQRVAMAERAVTVNDLLEAGESYTGFPERFGLRAVLAVPLIIRGEVVGCLFAWMKSTPRAFNADELDFAQRMAASVALALENARLLESVRTALERAERAEGLLTKELERTRVLLHAADQLTSTTEVDELLTRLSGIVLEATGMSRVFVNLIDVEAKMLYPKVATGGLVEPSGQEVPFDSLSVTSRRAIAAAKTALLDYELPDLPDCDRRIAQANGARLVLFVPLVFKREVIGHISVDEPNSRYEFSPAQVRIVESIAAQAAVAVQNARAFEREHQIAETLQQAILSPPDRIDALEVACLYQPASTAASVGGDFYDVIDLGGDRAALLIGDVAGKGIEAARLTALVRDGIRAYLLDGGDPAEVIAKLNALAFRFMPADKFATVFLGVLECESGTLLYSGGGHPEPIVLGKTGTRRLRSTAGLVGAFEDSAFDLHSTALEPGETLVLVTDGITEARSDGGMLGMSGLDEVLDRLRGTETAKLPVALRDEVLAFSGGRLSDDAVILCVRLKSSTES